MKSIVRSRQQLVPEHEGFGDHGNEAWADFSLGAIRDDEALPLAGAPQGSLDRHDGREIPDCCPA